ncbi:MAG: formyltransferase [Pseudonocardiaceae bacterium]
MTAVVFAYHDVGCTALRVLRRLGVEISLVYTHNDTPGESTWFGSVRQTCTELGLPVRTADPRTVEEQDRIRNLAPKVIFSVYWRELLPESVLELASQAAVNLHGSLLPRYRGRAPVNWQILHGEREGGVTLHHMVRRADAGDIIDQEAFPIRPDDTPTDVYVRLVPAAARVLERSALTVIEGTAARWPQLESKATVFQRRRPEDGLIDFRYAAQDVRNLVRAVTKPYPGAFTYAGQHKTFVWWARHDKSGRLTSARPGALDTEGNEVLVACGDRRQLCLERVEIDGREGSAADFPDLLHSGALLSPTPTKLA